MSFRRTGSAGEGTAAALIVVDGGEPVHPRGGGLGRGAAGGGPGSLTAASQALQSGLGEQRLPESRIPWHDIVFWEESSDE